MPQNTTNTSPGVPVEFQNPTAPVVELDSEFSNIDPVTGLPIVREFVIPVDSISGQTSEEVIVPILNKILAELRAIRFLTEAGATPEVVDEVDDIFALEMTEIEVEES